MASFSSSQTEAFLAGEWVPCISSNVAWAAYNEKYQTLSIVFNSDPVPYNYDNVPLWMADYFARASSKGTWVWDNLRRQNWGFTRG